SPRSDLSIFTAGGANSSVTAGGHRGNGNAASGGKLVRSVKVIAASAIETRAKTEVRLDLIGRDGSIPDQLLRRWCWDVSDLSCAQAKVANGEDIVPWRILFLQQAGA